MTMCSAAYVQAGSDLAQRYADAIGAYCLNRDESALVKAYDMAREALQNDLSLADFGTMHHAALSAILLHCDDGSKAVDAAEEFFLEGIAVYDMALRGYRTNVSRLQAEIAERRRVEEQLRDITLDLERQRDSLDSQVQLRTAEIRERARELEQSNAMLIHANREQADFTYALSHDLKTPINTIEMYLQTLLEDFADIIDDDAIELIGIASDTAVRMKKLIDDVLEYSRVVEHSFNAEPVDLNRLVPEIISDMQAAIVDAEATVLPSELPTVRGNPFQLRVLFTNLLTNALKFRNECQRPEIRISARDRRSGAATSITVADNGIGIRSDQRGHIFDLFKRLHTFDEYHGSGIGLALCKRVADNHGTEIQVTSEEGSGSSFSIILETCEDIQ